MYKVLCDGALMCDSRIEELALINPVANLEENKAGSFSFSITPAHPKHDAIQRRKSIVEVYDIQGKDKELLFYGVCIEADEDFYKQKRIYCEGPLTYFNDSIQRPMKYQGTIRGYLEVLVSNHNAQVEEEKQFQVGMVTVRDSNDYMYCYTNMESTMKCLKEDLVDDLGGIIRIRHENGVKYVDYLADSPNTNSQAIRLGKNLVDFSSNIDTTDIATAIIPLGAKLETSAVEGLETRLTIESVNDGKDYVYSESAVGNFGWIYKVVTFDDVTDPNNLKAKAEEYLNAVQFENVVIEAKAVDMHLTDKNIERFKVSDEILVISEPHGLNKRFRLTKQTLNLNNPEKDTVTLGKNEVLSLSAKTASVQGELEQKSESILSEAIKNATSIIANAMGGYVVKTNDEILIMDTNDIKTAKKVWRWNINGLGYSSNGYAGPYKLAMTMDGAIVADMITAGVLNSIKINNGNGEFTVDEKGNVVANSLTSNNATITGGSFNVKKSSFDFDVLSLESNDYYINFTSNSIEFYNKTNYEYTKLNSYGLHLGTYEGTPPFGRGNCSILLGRSYYCDSSKIRGNLTVTGTTTLASSPVISSDRSLKEEISELDVQKATDFIYALKPCEFKYKNGTSNRLHHGLIAQDVKESMGETDWGIYIDSAETGEKGIRYEELIADLIATVQTQNERIKALEKG